MKLRIQTVALDGKSGVLRQKVLQRQSANALKQFFKASGRKSAKTEPGTDPGSGYTSAFHTSTVECDGGRVVPAMYKVVVC